MNDMDSLIDKHAKALERVHSENTVGDFTFHGALTKFLMEAKELGLVFFEEDLNERVMKVRKEIAGQLSTHVIPFGDEEFYKGLDFAVEVLLDGSTETKNGDQ